MIAEFYKNKLKTLIKASPSMKLMAEDMRQKLYLQFISMTEADVLEMIKTFEQEKVEMDRIAAEEAQSAPKVAELTANVVAAERGLNRAVLSSNESQSRAGDDSLSQGLLNELDSI